MGIMQGEALAKTTKKWVSSEDQFENKSFLLPKFKSNTSDIT